MQSDGDGSNGVEHLREVLGEIDVASDVVKELALLAAALEKDLNAHRAAMVAIAEIVVADPTDPMDVVAHVRETVRNAARVHERNALLEESVRRAVAELGGRT